MSASTEEIKSKSATPADVWKILKEVTAKKPGAVAKFAMLVTCAKMQIVEKTEIMARLCETQQKVTKEVSNVDVMLVIASANTLAAGLALFDATKEDLGLIVVSPHAPGRDAAIAELIADGLIERDTLRMLKGDDYVICDPLNTCGGFMGKCDGKCGRHPVRVKAGQSKT